MSSRSTTHSLDETHSIVRNVSSSCKSWHARIHADMDRYGIGSVVGSRYTASLRNIEPQGVCLSAACVWMMCTLPHYRECSLYHSGITIHSLAEKH
jgi:hypothetical protein